MLYLSGQVGTDAKGKLVKGGVAAETKQAMENVKALLAKCGSSLADVIEVTVALADIAEWEKMNTVYASYFDGQFPARSAFAAKGLALGARVEISCKAVAK